MIDKWSGVDTPNGRLPWVFTDGGSVNNAVLIRSNAIPASSNDGLETGKVSRNRTMTLMAALIFRYLQLMRLSTFGVDLYDSMKLWAKKLTKTTLGSVFLVTRSRRTFSGWMLSNSRWNNERDVGFVVGVEGDGAGVVGTGKTGIVMVFLSMVLV